MKFKKGDKAFFMWVGDPTEIIIIGTWGEDRYKFRFADKGTGGSGWTLKENEVFATMKELIESNISYIDSQIESLKKEREKWCSFVKAEDGGEKK